MRTTTKRLAGLNGLLGLWLLAAPFVFDASTAAARWNDALVGTALALSAGYNYSRTTRELAPNTRLTTLNATLGLWLIVAPFAFGVDGASLWNDVVVGTLVTSFAGYNTYVGTSLERNAAAADRNAS